MKRALSIAGSDCSGGAGIQADLKTFLSCGVYGMSVLTAVTAQNTVHAGSILLVPAELVPPSSWTLCFRISERTWC